MNPKHIYATLGATLLMLLTWMVGTTLVGQQLIGDREKQPTSGCKEYNTDQFAFRVIRPQAQVHTGKDAEKASDHGADAPPDVAAASLEAACQANAIARASIGVSNVNLIVAEVAVALSAFALLFLGFGREAFAIGRRRGQSALRIDTASGGPSRAEGWLVGNEGSGVAFVHGVCVSAATGGTAGAAIAQASTFAGSGFEVAAGAGKPFDWTGPVVLSDVVVAVRFSDSTGRRGIAWARFDLLGCPAQHRKSDEGEMTER